jgi:hypothetical protein
MDASIGEHAEAVFQLTYTPASGTGHPHAPCAFLALSQQALAQQEIDSTQTCRRCARVIGIHSLKHPLCTPENNAGKSDVDLEQELDVVMWYIFNVEYQRDEQRVHLIVGRRRRRRPRPRARSSQTGPRFPHARGTNPRSCMQACGRIAPPTVSSSRCGRGRAGVGSNVGSQDENCSREPKQAALPLCVVGSSGGSIHP